MDFGALMKLKPALNKFNENHPKFMPFVRAVGAKGITEGTILALKVTTPDGEEMETNLKVQQSDLDLFELIKKMQ